MAEFKPDDDDDGELELEPVDPEILAQERERARQKTNAAVGQIDVDELYGDTGSYSDLRVDWSTWRQFRFTTRHLLILTALLAILLTMFLLLGGVKAMALVVVVALAGGWLWASRLERQQAAERARRREEFFADRKGPSDATIASVPADSAEPRRLRPEFKFAFSMKELLITMTAAAVVVALAGWIGLSELAAVCGMLALLGLVLQAVGYDPPRLFVLGWWLVLVIYLLVGLAAGLGFAPEAGA
jgi:hypothetical protein